MRATTFFFLASFTIGFISCSNDVGKCHVMVMTGSVMDADNPRKIELSKGDSIVLVHHCIHGSNPCNTAIYGFYKGTLLEADVIWKDGKIQESYSYEKAVFLKNK